MYTNYKKFTKSLSSFSFPLLLLFLPSCFLEHFTEPDQEALREMSKYEKQKSVCQKNSGVCYARKTKNNRRYKFNEEYYLEKLENSNDAYRTRAATEVAEAGITNSKIISKLDYLALNDSSKWVRRASVKALAKLQGKQAINTLSLAEKDKDPWVRHSAKLAKNKLK